MIKTMIKNLFIVKIIQNKIGRTRKENSKNSKIFLVSFSKFLPTHQSFYFFITFHIIKNECVNLFLDLTDFFLNLRIIAFLN
jgi:hypothetical protein